MPKAEILKTIKSETRDLHARVENLVPVFSESFVLADYRRLLERFYGFYAAFEPLVERLDSLAEILPDWPERRRLPLLEEDLLWLGHVKPGVAKLAVCSEVPPVHTPALAIGALYVTEGSTLGGQIICRHLVRSLHIAPQKGATFFYGHGEETGPKWKIFTEALCRLATDGNESQIVQSAVDTFKAMELWLSQSLPGNNDLHAYGQLTARSG